MKTAADRHKLDAYRKKHCGRAFKYTDIDDLKRP